MDFVSGRAELHIPQVSSRLSQQNHVEGRCDTQNHQYMEVWSMICMMKYAFSWFFSCAGMVLSCFVNLQYLLIEVWRVSHDLVQVPCVPWSSRLCKHAPPRPISLAVWGSFTAQKHLRQSSFFSPPSGNQRSQWRIHHLQMGFPTKTHVFCLFPLPQKPENLWEFSTPGKSREPRDPQVTAHRQIARSSPRWSDGKPWCFLKMDKRGLC